MPTPVARLLASTAATFTTTDSGPAPVSRTRWFWLIWPVPIRSVAKSSTRAPTASLSHVGERSSIWRMTSIIGDTSPMMPGNELARGARRLELLLLQIRARAVDPAVVDVALGDPGVGQALPDDRALLAARPVVAAALLRLDERRRHQATASKARGASSGTHRAAKAATRAPAHRTSASTWTSSSVVRTTIASARRLAASSRRTVRSKRA